MSMRRKCPICGRRIPVKAGRVARHPRKGETRGGYSCPGSLRVVSP